MDTATVDQSVTIPLFLSRKLTIFGKVTDRKLAKAKENFFDGEGTVLESNPPMRVTTALEIVSPGTTEYDNATLVVTVVKFPAGSAAIVSGI
ncbi:MAG: hypothetical protein WCL08_04030 [Verrucomicrobiota bacterium]